MAYRGMANQFQSILEATFRRLWCSRQCRVVGEKAEELFTIGGITGTRVCKLSSDRRAQSLTRCLTRGEKIEPSVEGATTRIEEKGRIGK